MHPIYWLECWLKGKWREIGFRADTAGKLLDLCLLGEELLAANPSNSYRIVCPSLVDSNDVVVYKTFGTTPKTEEEKKYTLDEARKIIGGEACLRAGGCSEFTQIKADSVGTITLICERCGTAFHRSEAR